MGDDDPALAVDSNLSTYYAEAAADAQTEEAAVLPDALSTLWSSFVQLLSDLYDAFIVFLGL
jgi:hypothetical protein